MKFDLINGMVSEHLHGHEMRNLRTVPQNRAVHVCSGFWGVFASRDRINMKCVSSEFVGNGGGANSKSSFIHVEQNRKG